MYCTYIAELIIKWILFLHSLFKSFTCACIACMDGGYSQGGGGGQPASKGGASDPSPPPPPNETLHCHSCGPHFITTHRLADNRPTL